MYCVYAIYNKDKKRIYIGQTNNLERRLAEHESPNIHYTGKHHGQWVLIYQEKCIDRSMAIAREKQLKSFRGREFLKRLIKEKY